MVTMKLILGCALILVATEVHGAKRMHQGKADAPRVARSEAAVGAAEAPTSQHQQTTSWKKVPANTTWQWILNGKFDASVPATLYDIDLFNYATVPAYMTALRASNRIIICYFSAGTLEGYFSGSRRVDYKNFTGVRVGKPVVGFEEEAWINVNDISLAGSKLASALRWRMDYAKRLGCDGVEPDNVDSYTNSPGFAVTPAQQITFNKWLATEAHARGLAVALKNDGDQVPSLVSSFDFAVVEQCYQYNECGSYAPFIQANKAVLIAEYRTWTTVKAKCPAAATSKFSLVKKGGTARDGSGIGYDVTAFPWCSCSTGKCA